MIDRKATTINELEGRIIVLEAMVMAALGLAPRADNRDVEQR
jgi:hypothetical protein